MDTTFPTESTGGGLVQTAIAPENAQAEETQAKALPVLRNDIELLRGEFDPGSGPIWTLHDPLKGKFYRLGWLQFELLSRWSENSAPKIVMRVAKETTLTATVDDVDALAAFLSDAELIEINDSAGIKRLRQNEERRKSKFLTKAFSFTMYHKVPLVNPDRFLTILNYLCAPVFRFSTSIVWMFVLLGAIALIGISSHWYEFKDTFMLTMNPAGFAGYIAVLAFINVVHECGHGLLAKRYGCRVPVMGLALIFMLPVCYSDVSDAWRLRNRRQRLIIDAGGLLLEIALAILAVLAWLALPDGILKMLAFFVAVTSLATTLFINLNPFMKFDGYFLLADSVRVENLQTKSLSNFKWELRTLITGVTEPMPFPVVHKVLIFHRIYATSICIYRVFLYLGIAYMVYAFWFKVLGLILMSGVFVSMVIRPILKELSSYMRIMKSHGVTNRAVVSMALLVFLVAMLLIPLPRKVSAPAILTAQQASRIYAPSTADISAVHVVKGQSVGKGEKLITLSSPTLFYQRSILLEEIEMLERRLVSESDWSGSAPLQEIQIENIDSKRAELVQVQSKIADLELRSPVDGEVVLIEEWVRAGSVVAGNMILAEVVTTNRPEIRAYVTAYDKKHVDFGKATFIDGSNSRPFKVEVRSVSNHAIARLDDEVLSIPNGGPIAVSSTQHEDVKPKNDLYLAVLDPVDSEAMIRHEYSGVVMFPAKARSLAGSVVQRVYGVLLRESGF